MTNPSPLFSVITAAHNSARTIGTTLQSIVNQDYPHVECIVIDGASTDQTLSIAHKFEAAFQSPRRLRIYSETDQGIYDALNKGLAHAQGDFIGFLHSDDTFSDAQVLSRLAKAFVTHQARLVYGDLRYVYPSGEIQRYWRAGNLTPRRRQWGWVPPHPATYFRRSLLTQVGLFDSQMRIAADFEHGLKLLAAAGTHVHYVPEVLVDMRTGGISNRNLRNILLKSREDYRVLRKLGVGGLPALLYKNLSKITQFFAHHG